MGAPREAGTGSSASTASLAAVAVMLVGLLAVLPLAAGAALFAFVILPMAVAGIAHATSSGLLGMVLLSTLAAIPLIYAWLFATGLAAAWRGRRLPRARAVLAALMIPAGAFGIWAVTPEHVVSHVIRENAGGERLYLFAGLTLACLALTLVLRSPFRCADEEGNA